MGKDPRKRQKKLQRRKAKQKAERRERARHGEVGLPARLGQASAAPILHCCTQEDIWETGLGQVLVSRQLADSTVAFAVFLVDMYGRGVKDVFASVVPQGRYKRDLYEKLAGQFTLLPLQPECARKLVEGAVQYAADLGVAPHRDYRVAKLIFGDIRAEACMEEFEYGLGGKPMWISGPSDFDAAPEEANRCWNCGRQVPEGAKVCRHCEADLTEQPLIENLNVVRDVLERMPPAVLEQMREIAQGSSTAEEFADRIMVDDCPRCGSSQTGNCEKDPEIDDISLGRCFECGQMWCTLCERLLDPGETSCDCELDLGDEDLQDL